MPLRFGLLAGVTHGISTRHGGISPAPYRSLNVGMSTGDLESNVLANRTAFFRSLGLRLEDVVVGRLTHGNAVSVFRRDVPSDRTWRMDTVRSGSSRRERAFFSDAVVSNVPGLHFFLTAADCIPLAFYDNRRRVVGAAHAGWRGTAAAIAPAVVRSMGQSFDCNPADLRAGIGPSIGPCCYAVDDEVLARFRIEGHDPVVEKRDGKTFLDLWATTERQLQGAGLLASSIENPRLCTSCRVGDFFSHRAERGRTGRFGLCIGL